MFSIDGGTVDTLIREVIQWRNKTWHKTPTGYEMDHDHKYYISIDTQGPIPILIMEQKLPDQDWGRGTDLDPWAFNEEGKPQFWIATLLDKVSGGKVPVEDTAKNTVDFMNLLSEKCRDDAAELNRLVNDVRFGRYTG